MVIDDPLPAGWLMQRLFAYEEVLDIVLGVVDVAATSDDADSAAKFAELQGRLDRVVDVDVAIFLSQPQRVEEAEVERMVQSFTRVAMTMNNFGNALERRTRRTRRYEAAANRWRGDRQVEVGRAMVFQRAAEAAIGGRRLLSVFGADNPQSEQLHASDSSEEDDGEETCGEEVTDVDDDSDSQVDLL